MSIEHDEETLIFVAENYMRRGEYGKGIQLYKAIKELSCNIHINCDMSNSINRAYHCVEKYRMLYKSNLSCLSAYPFWLAGPLRTEDTDFLKIFRLDDEKYIYWNDKELEFSDVINLSKEKSIEKPILRNESQPFLLENVFSPYIIKYVVDNTRRSEDFGRDNHIYLYYEKPNDFIVFLHLIDIHPFIEDNKVIILIGKETLNKNYPIDLSKYGIHLDGESKPIRLEEIKRLFVCWNMQSMSGKYFFSGIMDCHKNLLTAREFALAEFHYLHIHLLENHTVIDVIKLLQRVTDPTIYKIFELMGSDVSTDRKTRNISLQDLFDNLRVLFPDDYRPSRLEWFKGFFLAYNYALKRTFHSRTAPAICYQTHTMTGEKYVWKPEDTKDIFLSFPYLRIVSTIRNISFIGAALDWIERSYSGRYNYIEHVARLIREYTLAFLDENDEFLPYRGIVRFEDLKLHPRASLEALCDFLDLEWDDHLLSVTANGIEAGMRVNGYNMNGFDPKPVYNRHDNFMCSPFDYYRFELLVERTMLTPWGYKPSYHKDGMTYTKEEIVKLFDIRFKCENFHKTKIQTESNAQARERLRDEVIRMLDDPLLEKERGVKRLPIPWIKPKEEFLEGKLYE